MKWAKNLYTSTLPVLFVHSQALVVNAFLKNRSPLICTYVFSIAHSQLFKLLWGSTILYTTQHRLAKASWFSIMYAVKFKDVFIVLQSILIFTKYYIQRKIPVSDLSCCSMYIFFFNLAIILLTWVFTYSFHSVITVSSNLYFDLRMRWFQQ